MTHDDRPKESRGYPTGKIIDPDPAPTWTGGLLGIVRPENQPKNRSGCPDPEHPGGAYCTDTTGLPTCMPPSQTGWGATPSDPERRSVDVETLADAVDQHWMDKFDTGVVCSCGDWFFAIADDHPLPELGDHFRPFSKHVAAALLAAIPQDATPADPAREFTRWFLRQPLVNRQAFIRETMPQDATPTGLDVERLARALAIVQPSIIHLQGKDWTPYAERIAAEFAATDPEAEGPPLVAKDWGL